MNRFVVLLVIFCGVFLTFQTAQAGWVEFFFPSLRDTSDDPSQTLTAPFADGVGAEASSKEGVDNQGAERSIVNIVPLSQPHRTVGMVSNWVVEAVSNALSFQNDDFKVDMQKTQVYFDPGGWGEFQKFLQENKILDVLKSSQYKVHSYVSETPLLLNEGAVSGRYRWLFQVPVTISYMKSGMKDYKGVTPTNQSFLLRVQVGRTEDVKNDLGIQVERWSGKATK